MNRSFTNVLFGAFGSVQDSAGEDTGKTVKSASAAEAAEIMEQADTVVIVPGYGMAVAQAQHRVRELYDQLTKRGIKVKFAIHPVAGRMPGHMNVLAEADIPYDDLVEMEEINAGTCRRSMSCSCSGPTAWSIPRRKTTRSHPSTACPSSKPTAPAPCWP